MRPSASPLLNPSGLVDKRLQPMWDQLEQVRLLLPQIAHVSYYMESIFNLDRNLTLLTDENVDHHILKDIQIFQGANAYEIAVAEGFVGNVSTWLESLIGDKGDTGLLDEVAHQALIDGIAAAEASAAAAQTTANTAISTFSSYTLKSTYDARVAYVDGVIADLETTISDIVTSLLPPPRTDLEITNLAQAAINTSLSSVNSSIGVLEAALENAGADISELQTGFFATTTEFGTFLVNHETTLSRIDTLEATSISHTSSLISLQSVSEGYAASITTLEAASATSNAQILDLQAVNDDTAVQINNLQVSNNANAASIETIETAYVTADEALATSISTLAATVTTNATTAAAAVSTEASARATADTALATSISSVSSSLGSLSATVSTQATAITSIDGRVAAKYNLTLDVGGRISGFTSEVGGGVASFNILADVFSISKPGGGERTEYSSGNWRIYDSSGTLRVRLGVW